VVGAQHHYGTAKLAEPSLVVALDISDDRIVSDMVAGSSNAVPPLGAGRGQPADGVAERAEQRPTSWSGNVVEQASTAAASDNALQAQFSCVAVPR
jgi:hypothetical protein